jgi:hypothetical protein
MTQKIEGGYYIKAKCIQNSDISYAPPHVREIWDWLIKEANFKDTKICLRGQTIRSYKDIIDGLSWKIGWRKISYTKAQCENSMKYLVKHTMIATQKLTRGLLITVLNYDKYQDIENYKKVKSATMKATGVPQECHTIKKERKELNNTYTKKYLLEIPLDDLEQISKDIGVSKEKIILKGKTLYDWCEAKGRVYKNYKAFLKNCLRGDKEKQSPQKSIQKDFNSLLNS